ncbi:MAG: hypothetical protein WCE30_10995 [Mycobacterium sp.]
MTHVDEDPESAGGSSGADTTDISNAAAEAGRVGARFRGANWGRTVAVGLLPALAMLLGLAAATAKYVEGSARTASAACVDALQAAKTGSVAMLSYKPETVARQLGDARELLTGDFRNSYTSLTHDVVIPGALQKHIAATATVPAAAVVSAGSDQAVVLVFINQTVVVGTDTPTNTASTVRVTLDNVDGRWLIARFDPI